MVSNRAYIQLVNNAVKRGKHNRPIKIVYTKNRPMTEGRQGIASHINMREYDRIAIWKGLPKNHAEKIRYENRLRKKLGRPVKVITRKIALRHELWHLHKPYASEKEVRRSLEKKTLPNTLPMRRRY